MKKILAFIIILAIAGTGFYLYTTQTSLKTLKDDVKYGVVNAVASVTIPEKAN